jgi:hypothetical protein
MKLPAQIVITEAKTHQPKRRVLPMKKTYTVANDVIVAKMLQTVSQFPRLCSTSLSQSRLAALERAKVSRHGPKVLITKKVAPIILKMVTL